MTLPRSLSEYLYPLGRNITDKGLVELLRVCGNQLQTLNLKGTNFSGEGLESYAGELKDVRSLNLGFNGYITDKVHGSYISL